MSASVSIDLNPQGELHRKLVSRLLALMRMGQQAFSDRYTKWNELENSFLAYLPEKETDTIRRGLRNSGQPQYTTLTVPYSYAMMLTAHTYLTSVFLGRNPVLQVQGRHGETIMGEQAMEALLDYQLTVGKHLPSYYIWMHDSLKYGLGIVGYYWDKQVVRAPRYEMQQKEFLGIPVGKPKKVRVEVELPGYEGTKLYNVRPQDWISDPRVTMANFQEGEFCGRYVELAWNDLLEGAEKGDYVNLDALKQAGRGSVRGTRIQGSAQMPLPGQNNIQQGGAYDEMTQGSYEGYELYVDLIPSDWGLGRGKLREKWVFVFLNSEIVVSARPLGYYHNSFPFEVLESEIGGHALYNRSMLEVLQPMNDVLSWLVNTHFYNVRKSLNDQFLVDPSRVVMKDFTDPNPGRLLRLKPEAYGTDVRTVVSQLPVQDVTRAHLQDFNLVADMMQRVGGVNDSLMGMVNGGRRSATEVRASTTFGVNRMKTTAEYFSACGFGPLTQQLVQTTQQMYEDEKTFRIAGDLAKLQSPYRMVTPEDIAGFYDFVPVDGAMPVDRYAQVNLWQALMGQMGKMPQVAQQYDMGRIFGFVAQLAGLKNINQFRIQVVPDAMAQQGVQAGNLVNAAEPSATTSGMVEPGQLPGMGATL